MTKYVTATEARRQFFSLIEKAGKPGFPVTITHEGIPRVIVMSSSEFEGWQETLEIMADSGLLKSINSGLLDAKKGRTTGLKHIKKKLTP